MLHLSEQFIPYSASARTQKHNECFFVFFYLITKNPQQQIISQNAKYVLFKHRIAMFWMTHNIHRTINMRKLLHTSVISCGTFNFVVYVLLGFTSKPVNPNLKKNK